MNYQLQIKVAAISVSLVGVIITLGFGCGVGLESASFLGYHNNSGFSSFTGPSDAGENGNLNIVSGTRTVALANYTTVLESMTSMTNVEPSLQTRNSFSNNLGSFSETGSTTSINAPLLFAYISVGAEVCNDLINSENGLPINNRRFFNNINLGTGNTLPTMTDENIANMIKRLARQFWQREETPEELQLITLRIKEILAAKPPTTSGLARQGVLATCTAMIASTSAIEI